MIFPVARALAAFQVIYSSIPGPFHRFIIYTIVVTIIIRVLLAVVEQ